MNTELIIIRHGETEWNATGRIQGHRPVLLNERGHLQASAVAKRLKDEPFDALYSSDLDRTVQTAEAIAQVTGHAIVTDARLREWDLGILAGLTRQEAEAQYPDVYAIYRDGIVDEPILEGESIRARYTRVIASLEECLAQHPNQRIVIVTHGGPLGDCYRRVMGLPPGEALGVELYNGGINLLAVAGDSWAVNTWGDIAHLNEIGSMGDWEGRK